MKTLTGRVRTGGREVQGLHPDNACNNDTWEFPVSLELTPSAAAPRYLGLTRCQEQTQSSGRFSASILSSTCRADTSAASR